MILDVIFEENEQEIAADFGEVLQVGASEIPKEYGRVTYTQDRTITVS